MTELKPLDQVRIVLSHPSHPGNIGSVARAMKTMGLQHLVLINPKRFPDPEAVALACGADDILAQARICGSMQEALAGTHFAMALTARRREFGLPESDARRGAERAIAEAQVHPVALVFGTEMSGLSNEEVQQCSHLVHIPANPAYSSLNLAQAVQLLCYELRMAAGASLGPSPYRPPPRADLDEVAKMFEHMERVLIDLQFLNPKVPKRLMPRLRRLFGRAELEREEVSILRGILQAISQGLPPKT